MAVFLSLFAILTLASFYAYNVMRGLLLQRIEESAEQLTARTANQIEVLISRNERVTENLADLLAVAPLSAEQIGQVARNNVLSTREIYGSAIAFEPYAFAPDREFYCLYYFDAARERGEVRRKLLQPPEYDYLHWDWYTRPKRELRPSWSEPFFDEGGGDILMTTYSVPLLRLNEKRERAFAGVVTADLSLAWLQQLVDSIPIEHSGYAFIIDNRGNLLTHPDPAMRIDTAEELNGWTWEGLDIETKELLAAMRRGQTGFRRSPDPLYKERSAWIAFAPIHSTRWSVGVIFPEKEIFADLDELRRNILFLFTLGALVLLLVVIIVARSVTRPILTLAEAVREIGSGRLDLPVPQFRSRDEVATLASAFEEMRTSLQTYIRNLAETTAAKERIESELQIARDIQMSILPKVFPPFPDRREFDLFAMISPAKVVGGDFYDFGIVEDGKLYFTIGDVSDKGIPAALFMAVIATLIKVTSREKLEPGEVLEKINRQICQGNDTCMFVTIFYGVLEIASGRLKYANAGHNPPVHLLKSGEVQFLPKAGGMALGLDDSVKLRTAEIELSPGDRLLLYTDGVTEAMNSRNEPFGDVRLRSLLQSSCNSDVQELLDHCLHKLKEHVVDAPQSDDITMLALYYRG